MSTRYGTLTLTNSTVSGNSLGGVYNFSGTVTLTNSTVSGNSASSGGGLYNVPGATLLLRQTLISGNAAGIASMAGPPACSARVLGGTAVVEERRVKDVDEV